MSTGESGETYDVVVIGGGPGGYVAAIRASQLGLRAAVVEREELGGICNIWGCIPSKALLRSAEVLSLFGRAAEFGIHAEQVRADYGAALNRCETIVAAQTRGVNFLMRKNKIDVVRGTARLAAPDRVAVAGGSDGDRELRTRNIIVATGSRVRTLPGVEIDGGHIVSAKEIWGIKTQPASIVIIGAGPIGVEFATIYQAFGTEVTLVEFLPRVLPLEDEESSAELAKQLRRRGVTIMTGTKVDGASVEGGMVTVSTSPAPGAQGQPGTITAERVLVSVGFVPNSADLGLEALGVELNRGFITIDDQMRTNIASIYAIGDVTGKLALAHTAQFQGELCAEAIAGHATRRPDYGAIPRCTYSQPQVASLGLTEQQARESGRPFNVGKFPFRPNGKARAIGELDGQVKIISDAETGEIMGVHMVGPDVTELIAELSLARTLESTPAEIAYAVHPHPTLSEAIAEAARAAEGAALHI